MFELVDPLTGAPVDPDAEAPPMDHEVGGWKMSQYSFATARIILARAARGDTVEAILAAPNMPCRRTLYDWLRDVPEFGRAWADLRADQARMRRRAVEDAEMRRAVEAFLKAEARGRRPPRSKAGRKSTYTRAAAEAWCALIRDGATLREAGAQPGMPAPPMVYRWLRNHPEFRAMYMAATEHRDFVLRDHACDLVSDKGYAARPEVDRLLARAAALMPDVWR